MNERYAPKQPGSFSLDGLVEYDFGENERKFTPLSRYCYSVLIDENGQKYFSKQLAGNNSESDEKWSKYLERESAWAEFATAVGEAHAELGFTGLSPVFTEPRSEGGVQRLVYPFIDAGFLSEPHMTDALHDPATLSRYSAVLKTLDTFAENWVPTRPIDNEDEHTPFDQVDKSWNEWLKVGNLYEDGHLTEEVVEKARQLVNDYSPFVTPRLQHGDFVPWHLFSYHDGDADSWISFDGEHASLMKPRFYDLAYSYSRLFTRSDDKELAAQLLHEFVALGVTNGEFTHEEFHQAFVPVLMSRSIGMFLDAHFDEQKGEDYTAEAKDLFERCQARSLEALIQI